MSFLAILETLNFELWYFGTWKLLKLTKNQNAEPPESKIAKSDISGQFEFTKIGFHVKSEWR